jgi:hypothetical protein
MCVHKKRDKIGRVVLMVTAAAVLAGLMAAEANAQSFTLSQNGKSVGTASLSMKQGSGGYQSSSNAKVDMPGLKYSFSQNASLNMGYQLGRSELKGSVNGTDATVDAAQSGQQFVMKINGQPSTAPLPFHPNTALLPDFDPAGLQTVLLLGAAHNNRDIWALIPKQTGSISALKIATKPDEQGTLDGRAIAVHHLSIASDAGSSEVFSGPSNELLQAEWTDEGFALVRQGFKLTPPKHPYSAPPAQPQQPAGQQPATQQPATQQPQQQQ